MPQDRLQESILRYLDGDLNPEEERALAARIRGNREAESLFAELMRFNANVTTVLAETAGEGDARHDLQLQPSRVRSGRRRPASAGGPPPLIWILAGAGFAAALLLALIASNSDEPLRKSRPVPLVKKEEPHLHPEIPPTPPTLPPTPPKIEEDPVPRPNLRNTVPIPDPAPPSAPETPKPTPPAPPPSPGAPAPAPEPPPARTTKVDGVVATVEAIKGEARLRTAAGDEPAKEGQTLLSGQGIDVGAGESSATLRLVDGSRLDLGAETRIDRMTSGDGKKIVLDQGSLTAEIRKQAPGQVLVIATPQAEARVLGTKFTLTVRADSTRLEVLEGRVRLTRLSDGAGTDVGPGAFAVSAPGTRPAAKRIPANNPRLLLAEDFESAAAFDARWNFLADGFPATARGRLDVDLSPRAGDSYAAGGWHSPGGVRIKQAIALPFRLTVDVEVTAKHDNLNAVVALAPASAKVGGLKNEVAVRLRGAEYAILVENNKVKTATAGGMFPLRSRWTVELDRQEVRFWAEGREIGRQAHGLTFTEDFRFELQGAAKADVPSGARVIFDNLKIEPLER